MKALLNAHDVWEVVEKGFTVLENEATLTTTQKDNLKNLKKKENKAKYLIFQSLDEDAFRNSSYSSFRKCKYIPSSGFSFIKVSSKIRIHVATDSKF